MIDWNKRLRFHLFTGILAGGLLLIILGQVSLPIFVLEVWDAKARHKLLSIPIRKGNHFFLQYTHSTAKTIVEEHFQIAGLNDIVLNRMVYSSGGAGIPDFPPAGAQFRIAPDGCFVMDDLNRSFPSLTNIRVAYFYPFFLVVEGTSYSLSKIARGRLVHIRIRDRLTAFLDRRSRE